MLKIAFPGLALGAILSSGPCAAHAKLQSSLPADNAQLHAAPTTLTLNFSEAAQLAALKLVGNGSETAVAVDKRAPAAQSITLPLPALAPGRYTVQWTAIAADDGHITRGSFVFSIAA